MDIFDFTDIHSRFDIPGGHGSLPLPNHAEIGKTGSERLRPQCAWLKKVPGCAMQKQRALPPPARYPPLIFKRLLQLSPSPPKFFRMANFRLII